MVLIIHGFPNDISALRFEWAWQHPQSSRRLHHVPKKKSTEKTYEFCLRVLSEMLLVGPWNRLPLNVRWLNEEFAREFPIGKQPPMHMPICYGPVISKKLKTKSASPPSDQTSEDLLCYLCHEPVEETKKVTCLNANCSISCHIICMSRSFLTMGHYVPVEGNCPKCREQYLWGDIVRKYKGCYRNVDLRINVEDNEFYCSEEED